MNIGHSPVVSFERTGQNLKLVDNLEFPVVWKNSLRNSVSNKGHFFAKAVIIDIVKYIIKNIESLNL